MTNQQGNWVGYDPSFDTEQNTRAAAKAAVESNERLSAMVGAMTVQLELSKASQASAEQTERFARGMAWASLIVAVASLGVAVAAIVVSVSFGG